jgi:hypothetical protein
MLRLLMGSHDLPRGHREDCFKDAPQSWSLRPREARTDIGEVQPSVKIGRS